MGTEAWYQSIPDGCNLLKRAVADPSFGELFSSPWRLHDPENCIKSHWNGDDIEFCKELQRLIKKHPGLENRHYSLDRYYDKILYLISEARRISVNNYLDIGTKAVRGSRELAAHLDGGQGHPLRFNTADEVSQIAEWLLSLKHEDLSKYYDPVKMQEKGVYKFFAGRDDEKEWQWIIEYFDGFVRFYAQAAKHREGVLITIV